MDTDTNSEDDDITDSAMVDEFNSEGNSSSGPVDLKKGPGSEDNDITDFAKVDEVNSERNSSSSRRVDFKKGQWSNEEDAILKAYVEKHGQGNWNAVQTFSGLLRCGKSCRLRWANHLRPYLKKGPFSPEEERKVIELHAKFGNKWARMALELPGRTDNEIKNFWNTRCKRLQRAGLPIYPSDVMVERQTENQQSPETPISNGSSPTILRYPADAGYHDIEVFKIPNNPILRSHSSPAFLDDPLLNMLHQVPLPNPAYSLSNMFPAIHPQGPVPAHNSNYMSVPLNPQDLDGYGTFSNNICPTIGLSDQVQESVIPYNGLTSGSFTAQSNRVPGLEDVRLPPHEVSTVNGLYPISDDPAPSCNARTHADINQYCFIEPSYESTLLELPSIQNPVSDLSFMGHIPPPPPPQADLNTLQSVAVTHQESTDPAETMADGFINDPLETYSQHDDLQDSAPNVPVSVDDIQLVESNDDVLLAGTDLVPCPTFMDSYQLDILAENEWFDGSGPEYALLDLAMSAFINDEDY